MPSEADLFSSTYREARSRLVHESVAAGAGHQSHIHPCRGFEGEELATDILLFGRPDAQRIVVLESATHGVEGFAGSAVQLAVVPLAAAAVAADIAVLYVHAINPYGFSFARRGDESNVDINRNFTDFSSEEAIDNPLFASLAPFLVPNIWSEESLQAADLALDELRAAHGEAAVSRAMRRGQYSHPGSVFFGGKAPSWSRGVVERIADEWLGCARSIILLDVHTGLGDFSALQLLTIEPPDGDIYRRLRGAFGATLRSTVDATSGAANATGNIFSGYRQALGPVDFVGVALEFGTYEASRVQRALRKDAWAYLDDRDSGRIHARAAVRDEMLEAFCPADSRWRERVVVQSLETFARAVELLRLDG